jgi:hypothetical protein
VWGGGGGVVGWGGGVWGGRVTFPSVCSQAFCRLMAPGQAQCVEAYRAGIFKQSMGARNREGIGLSYRPARLHRLAELMPWESIPRLIKTLKIRPLLIF